MRKILRFSHFLTWNGKIVGIFLYIKVLWVKFDLTNKVKDHKKMEKKMLKMKVLSNKFVIFL